MYFTIHIRRNWMLGSTSFEVGNSVSVIIERKIKLSISSPDYFEETQLLRKIHKLFNHNKKAGGNLFAAQLKNGATK